MRIKVSYSYKVYPGLDKYTKKSRWIGWATGAPGKILLGMGYLIAVAGIFSSLDWTNDWLTLFVVITTFAVPGWVLNPLKEKWYKELDQKYLAAVQALEKTDPARYYEIVQELNGKG